MVEISSLQALYGGTFDPVHYGHLKPVAKLADLIGLQCVIVMPDNVPPHRPQPKASSEQRKKMLELAIADEPLFKLDERELRLNSPSYTSHTIQEWRNKSGPHQPLGYILGQDSLLTFPSWHRYDTILNNSHLIVCRRPGYPLRMKEVQHQQWLERHLTSNITDLHSLPAGKIYLAETPWFDISATLIRQRLQQGLICEEMLPPRVLAYILQQGLYQKNAE